MDMTGKDLKTKIFKINLKDGEHEVVFDMNVLCELEEIYGDIKKGFKSFKTQPIKAARAFVYSFLKSEDDEMTLKKAGSLIDMGSVEELMKTITEAISDAMPDAGENTDLQEEDEKNG